MTSCGFALNPVETSSWWVGAQVAGSSQVSTEFLRSITSTGLPGCGHDGTTRSPLSASVTPGGCAPESMQSPLVTCPVDRSSSEMLVIAKLGSPFTTTRPAPGVATSPDPASEPVPLSGGGLLEGDELSPQAPAVSAVAS